MDHPENQEEIIRKKDLRIEFLEKQGQWQLFIFELLTSLSDLNHDAGISRDVHRLFSITQEYLFKVVRFESIAFYTINEEDSDFALTESFPPESKSSLVQEVDLQIDNGTFAWALHQNKPVLVETSNGEDTLVLHVLATKRRVRGMFAGIFKGRKDFFDENVEFPISLILQNAANALEGIHLYELVYDEKTKLERRVHERTKEIEEKAGLLQEELGFRKLAEENLRQTKEQLEQALKAKNEFFTNISHEFRTPLNAILGFSELMIMEADKLDRKDMKEDLETISSAANHLLTLINDILDMSVIRTGSMEINWEDVDIEPLLNSILPLVEPLANKNNNQISCHIKEKLGMVETDSTRFRQILLNLLGNACKFTENGSIFLSASQELSEEKSWLLVEVADTGPGIDAENIESIFQDFQQGNLPIDRKRAGTGLGLTISRNLARVMGGDLTVTTEVGQGSKFTLRLPCHREETSVVPSRLPVETLEIEEETLDVRSQENNGSRETFRDYDLALVADQSAVSRNLLASFLEKEGFKVVQLQSGEAIIDQALNLMPEVVVLGGLEDKSSADILNEIQNKTEAGSVPLILIESNGSMESLSDNVHGVLGQPIEWDRLSELCKPLKRHRNLPGLFLLDSDLMSGELLKRVLSKSGWKVRLEKPGRRILEKIRKEPPKAILLSSWVTKEGEPDWQIALEFGNDPVVMNIPLILFCARGEEIEKKITGKIKNVTCIEKGKCTRDELLAVLNHAARETDPASC